MGTLSTELTSHVQRLTPRPRIYADANVPALVDSLSSVLVAGQLASAARNNIVGYVTTNFPTSSSTWRRDRVRAVVHQIIDSPDYTIQR